MAGKEVDENALASFSDKADIYKVAGMDGGMEALAAFVYNNMPPDKSEVKLSTVEKQEQRVCNTLFNKYRFVRVKGIGQTGKIYYQPINSNSDEPLIFRPLTLLQRDTMIKEVYNKAYKRKPSAQSVKRFGETLESWVDDERERLNDRIIMVTKELYWDYDEQDFTDIPAEEGCFRALFDSRQTDDITVNAKDVSGAFINGIYKKAYNHLVKHKGQIVPDECLEEGQVNEFSFPLDNEVLMAFWVWANEDLDTFNDLLKAVAVNFFKVKPKGAFILIGKTRNGKSSFIKMLHTLFGSNNTSEVTLAQLDDPHVNMTLLSTMLNAPDEEEEGKSKEVLKAQSRFKMMATHKSILLPVYYSQEPQPVPTDFMSYHAMNDIPQWQGNGAEACLKRSIIIMFENDLSKMDNNGVDFEKETYTGTFFSYLLGIALAIAKYYSDKPLTFSDTQAAKKEVVVSEVDNMSVYIGRFFHWFPGGYSTVNLVWEDYKMWCDERGYRWSPKQAFSSKMKIYGGKHSRLSIGTDGEAINIVRFKQGGAVFYKEARITKLYNYTIDEITCGEPQSTQNRNARKPRSVIGWLDAENPGETDEEE